MANGETEIPASQGLSPKVHVTPVAPIWHTVVFLVVFLGLSSFEGQAKFAAQAAQEPSRIPTYIVTIAYEFVLLGYVWLFGLRRYRISLGDLIGGNWRRWADFWRDIGVALLFWLVVGAVIYMCSRLLHFRGLDAAKGMLPQTSLEVGVYLVLSCCAGFCEEVLFRGYLQRQFIAWTRSVAGGVALQAAVFGLGHLYQGGKAVLVISIYGALFGILAAMRKSLRPGIMQHVANDALGGVVGRLATKYKYLQIIKF